MKGIKSSIEKKLFLMIFLFITVVATIIGIISFAIYRKDSIQYNAERALSIAQTIASSIRAEEFVEIMDSKEKTPYWQEILDFSNSVYAESGALYLYILGNVNNQDVTYFIDAYDDDYTDPLDLGALEESSAHDEMLFETFQSGQPTTTDIYQSEGYGIMVSGYAAIKDSFGKSVGVVGVDISLGHINAKVGSFGLQVILSALILSILFSILTRLVTKRMIGGPVEALTLASEMLANGETEINLVVTSKDEIGRLTQSFQALSESSKKQVAAVQRLAKGDYSFAVNPKSEQDALNVALRTVLDENNAVFSQIQNAATQVASAAYQLASGTQNLAEGSIEQTSSTEQLATAISEVLEKTKENSESAQEALDIVNGVSELMQNSLHYMVELQSAMDSISESSGNISKINKTIDDIAFQTNILALNAAVEAARAGQHGKGFAVVADEVRNLASKSAQAAQETTMLIQASAAQVERGGKIVGEASESIQCVASFAHKTQDTIARINSAAQKQEESIRQINIGVEHISQVVQTNSAIIEESTAMSEEMSNQANLLSQTVAQFHLR